MKKSDLDSKKCVHVRTTLIEVKNTVCGCTMITEMDRCVLCLFQDDEVEYSKDGNYDVGSRINDYHYGRFH